MLELFSSLVGPDKLGGWVRSAVGALIGVFVAKWPWLSTVIDPATQNAIALAAAGLVVGIWQQTTKTDIAKVKMAEAVPSVVKIVSTDPVLVAATPPAVVQATQAEIRTAEIDKAAAGIPPGSAAKPTTPKGGS